MLVREQRAGSNYATYFVGPQGPQYRRDDTTGNVRWYVYDGLGSVSEEVDPSGNVTAARKYDVFGSVRSGQSGTSSQKFVGSLGHVSEDSTGLIYMRARYMDPATGRFISEDPGRHGVNWYNYCDDNPINRIDLDGKIWWEIAGILIAGLVAGIFTCILAKDWSLGTFIRGFSQGAITAVGSLGGVAIGALVGAVVGAIYGYFSNGYSLKAAAAGAVFGGIGGGAGGFEVAEQTEALCLLYNVIIGEMCALGEGASDLVQ
jgi:RHS repeat-associated protein